MNLSPPSQPKQREPLAVDDRVKISDRDRRHPGKRGKVGYITNVGEVGVEVDGEDLAKGCTWYSPERLTKLSALEVAFEQLAKIEPKPVLIWES